MNWLKEFTMSPSWLIPPPPVPRPPRDDLTRRIIRDHLGDYQKVFGFSERDLAWLAEEHEKQNTYFEFDGPYTSSDLFESESDLVKIGTNEMSNYYLHFHEEHGVQLIVHEGSWYGENIWSVHNTGFKCSRLEFNEGYKAAYGSL